MELTDRDEIAQLKGSVSIRSIFPFFVQHLPPLDHEQYAAIERLHRVYELVRCKKCIGTGRNISNSAYCEECCDDGLHPGVHLFK